MWFQLLALYWSPTGSCCQLFLSCSNPWGQRASKPLALLPGPEQTFPWGNSCCFSARMFHLSDISQSPFWEVTYKQFLSSCPSSSLSSSSSSSSSSCLPMIKLRVPHIVLSPTPPAALTISCQCKGQVSVSPFYRWDPGVSGEWITGVRSNPH